MATRRTTSRAKSPAPSIVHSSCVPSARPVVADGWVYTVVYSATDAHGNATEAAAEVRVPLATTGFAGLVFDRSLAGLALPSFSGRVKLGSTFACWDSLAWLANRSSLTVQATEGGGESRTLESSICEISLGTCAAGCPSWTVRGVPARRRSGNASPHQLPRSGQPRSADPALVESNPARTSLN
jgi:hypothetical protein